MNAPRATDDGYIQFLIGSPVAVSATEAARVQPDGPRAPAHDAFTRLLRRLEPDPAVLWEEVRPLLDPTDGVLVIDDSTPDTPRAKHIELVSRHWSGNHRAVVNGINPVTLLWSDGDRLDPTDYRVSHEATDGKTKNDHFGPMREAAHARGFRPKAVPFDGWYARVANPKRVRGLGWVFVTRLPSNRKVRIDRGPAAAVSDQPIAAAGTEAWLPEFGSARVFRVVAPNGDTTHGATNDLGMDEVTRRVFAELSWGWRSTTAGGSSSPGWSGARHGRRGASGTTSGARSGRSCGWSTTGSPPASVGSRPRWGSSARPCGSTSPTPPTFCPKWQLRNS